MPRGLPSTVASSRTTGVPSDETALKCFSMSATVAVYGSCPRKSVREILTLPAAATPSPTSLALMRRRFFFCVS